MKEVFVVSDNVISSLGSTTAQNFDRMLNQADGIQLHENPELFPNPFLASLIPDSAYQNSSSTSIVLTKFEQICVNSIQDAAMRAGINLTDPKCLLILSTTKGNVDLLKANPDNHQDVYLYSSAAKLQKHFQLAHEPIVVSNACISGLVALNLAASLLEQNLYEYVLVCGADVVCEFTISGFEAFKALSPNPCQPFDANRSGTSLGEAAATIVLTNQQPTPIQLLRGASSNDANHISGPSRTGDGLYLAVKKTLERHAISSLDFISAHGTGTLYNDEMESKAFTLAGLNKVPVNSLKGYIGHTFGAAGILESAITIESMRQNKLIASKGYTQADPSIQLNLINNSTDALLNTCLKTASGFGGCNAALIFKKLS